MRIGFFGNNNNYPLLLAEAILAQGHEVLFVVNKRERLHRPESRDPVEYGRHPPWLLDASHLTETDFMLLRPAIGVVLDALGDCDALVLNDLGPSLLPLLGRPAITFLTGSDLDYYANPELPQFCTESWSDDYRASHKGRAHRRQIEQFVVRQRAGLAASRGVNWALPGLFPALDRMLADCGVTPAQVFNLQMADLRRIAVTAPSTDRPLRVFCGTRLNWKLPIAKGRSILDYKGTDVLIHGVGRFVRETGQALELCVVRKGMHVAETEQLVHEEGLDDHVVWYEEMPLQELWREFQASDVIVEQLGSSIISMVALDAMACARPVIGNVRPEVPTPFSAADSPVCRAANADEVCAQLRALAEAPSERRRIGAASRAFVERYFSPARAAALCLDRLEDVRRGTPSCTARSWLLSTIDEQRVLAEALELRSERELDSARRDVAQAVAGAARQNQLAAALLAAWHGRPHPAICRRLTGPFVPDAGLSWRVPLPDLSVYADGDQPDRSSLRLFEDERELGPPHAPHDQIASCGAGRFSHWRDHLRMSTSDGTDPNDNGRAYTIVVRAG